MARRGELTNLIVLAGGAYVIYQLGIRGALGNDFRLLMEQMGQATKNLGKTLIPSSTTGGTGGTTGGDTSGTGTWTFQNGVWVGPLGRVYVQLENDGTYTAVFYNAANGSYTALVSHTSRTVAEQAVNAFVGAK